MEVDSPLENCEDIALRNNMLDHLSVNNDAHFKSQQKNEPDLTVTEKRQIAEDILEKNPGCFLSRFGAFLLERHLDYFSNMTAENYEVNFYVNELRKNFEKSFNKSVVRNRRLEALRRLTGDGDYFSDEEMRKRNPAMYEHLVGQYLTEEEKMTIQSGSKVPKSFTGIILNAIDEKEIEDRLKDEIDREESVSETDSDELSDQYFQNNCSSWGEFTNTALKPTSTKKRKKKKNRNRVKTLTDDEKEMMMNEFRSQMYSEFLVGKDSEFDYTTVDANREYDDLDMLEYDQQDKYFDSESPELLLKGEESSDSSMSSGIPPPRDLVQKMADLET